MATAVGAGRWLTRHLIWPRFRAGRRGYRASVPQKDDEEFKIIQGGVLLTIPIERAAQAHDLLKDGFNSFVDQAMGRVRNAVDLEGQVPEAVVYVASIARGQSHRSGAIS